MINRLIFWLSLLGMILALHLWIQKSRGFDQGCLGLDTHATATLESGCNEVDKLAASHLFGVSNAAWGYAFYFGLALLSFTKIVVRPKRAHRLHQLGEVGVLAAFIYSLYLVYEMGVVAQQWCVLCTCSAGIVTLLFSLHVYLRLNGGFKPVSAEDRGIELGMACGSLFAAMGVLVGLLLFVNRLGTRPLNSGTSGQEIQRLVGHALPQYIDIDHLHEVRACRFEDITTPLDFSPFITPDTPFLGAADGVTVAIFYDPNCGHCLRSFPSFLALVERYREQAKFYILPRQLWPRSVLQIAALHLAAQEGKSLELWTRYFDASQFNGKGMDVVQIELVFAALGLTTDDLANRLEAVKPTLQAQLAAAKAAGIFSTPTVFIDGLEVSSFNQSLQCVGKLIDLRIGLAAKQSPAATTAP
jgi:uncharacterized membrane protein/thiol-disulfide isomerase/thioredoxin